MGYEPSFIGLGRIGMVDKMVDDVEGRSYKGVSQSRWSIRVGMRVPQSLPSRRFGNLLFFSF